jgi:acetyl esterase/lipase
MAMFPESNFKMKTAFVTTIVMSMMVFTNAFATGADEPEFRLLWSNGAPEALGDKDADKPGFWVYPATKNPNGAAVIICPGGGYAIHATDHEGVQPAKYFNRIGVTAFVLRYRLSPYRHPIPLQDAQRALRLVRASASEFGIDPHRVGIMGFSAGGHLTSTALTHFDAGDATAENAIDKQSCRPDFGILGYPVISFVADYAHKGSAKNLLGDKATDEQLQSLSNDTQVTKDTPPVFLFHTSEDTGVPPENSLAFYAACHKAGVPAELHIYQQGPHGVGLANEHPALGQWIHTAGTWLTQSGLLTTGKRQPVTGMIKQKGEPLKFGTVAFKPDDVNAPVGWAMVRNGQFSIAANAGPVPGKYHVAVTDMGAVAPGPTVDDAKLSPAEVVFEITEGSNELSIDLP